MIEREKGNKRIKKKVAQNYDNNSYNILILFVIIFLYIIILYLYILLYSIIFYYIIFYYIISIIYLYYIFLLYEKIRLESCLEKKRKIKRNSNKRKRINEIKTKLENEN
jgi:hypothetical protein